MLCALSNTEDPDKTASAVFIFDTPLSRQQ